MRENPDRLTFRSYYLGRYQGRNVYRVPVDFFGPESIDQLLAGIDRARIRVYVDSYGPVDAANLVPRTVRNLSAD